jgi:glycosyltransferase involved in cell wall biosynthesis
MFKPTKVIDIEISRPLGDLVDLGGYGAIQALVRLHGAPIGYVRLPVISGRCVAHALMQAVLEKHSRAIVRSLVAEKLATTPLQSRLRPEDLFNLPAPGEQPQPAPLVTIAVCTRDRASDLKLCLDSLRRVDYPALDIIVVDNAPATDATERLMQENYSFIRYVCEPRPGLDWARNRAIIEARGEIIAYTDDDVVVDTGWVRALTNIFVENPDVMAVTGLVVPFDIETEAQHLFERYGGFGRGFEYKWVRIGSTDLKKIARLHGGTGKFGTGANMAFRRSVFEEIGDFDPALDVGSVTNGGGDLEMFFRVLKKGHTLVYEPKAIVRHRHRKEYAQLHSQMINWGTGFSSYLVRSALAYPDERSGFLRLGMWWMRRLLALCAKSFVRHTQIKDLILAEIRGAVIGLFRYQKARANAAKILKAFGPQTGSKPLEKMTLQRTGLVHHQGTALRTIDIAQPLRPIDNVQGYNRVRVFVTLNGRPLGNIDITGLGESVSVSRLRNAIADGMTRELFEPDYWPNRDTLSSSIHTAVVRHYMPRKEENPGLSCLPSGLSEKVSVSIVVATLDRPDDLRRCLKHLFAQKTTRPVEIIVVDNNSSSGLTPPVVAEFPGVLLTREYRGGLSYARNKGIVVSKGSIIAVTDDDAAMPDDWLENLVAPFVQDNVMIVTGNVLPMELETPAQHLFELYGGLGRGFSRRKADGDWFESFRRRAVPTWQLGATACAAFRADIFSHPSIGLLDEALGAGTPTGCSEDTYLFYKVLKEGYTIVYEPMAYVLHKHRRDMRGLRRQIYNYSKGHVAYHLTTLFRDRDLRALTRLFIELPCYHASRLKGHLLNRSVLPLSLTLLEISGNLAGAWALWRSRRRVKRDGLSDSYIPVAGRTALQVTSPCEEAFSASAGLLEKTATGQGSE